ncbi:MAG: ABC transporter permease [Lachnospiraceae bacterium]|jgi:spermidine/putrescine transport system permease protein|nr:ABC transporter permease [Lachnospiraceae bacterium]
MTRAGKAKLMTGLGRFYTVLVYIFLFLPISVIVVNSMNATTSKPYLSWKGFTLSWYAKLWSNTELLSSFGNTMIIAIVSTLVSTAIGTLAAVGLYRYRFRGKDLINGLLYIPVVIPEIVFGISLLSMFAKMSIPRGMFTLILAHISFSVPFVVFNVRACLTNYDISVEEASMDLGANRVKTFFNVTFPMLMPGITGGALLAFTLSIDDVIISYFVNGQTKTYPLKVMESIKSGVSPDVNALSTLILLGTILFVILTQTNVLKKLVRKK